MRIKNIVKYVGIICFILVFNARCNLTIFAYENNSLNEFSNTNNNFINSSINKTSSNFINTILFVDKISSKYGIHPFIVLGIAWNETKFEPYAINMNRFNFVVYDKNDAIAFLDCLKNAIDNASSFINATKLYVTVYYGGQIVKNLEFIYSMNGNKEVNMTNLRYAKTQLNGVSKYNLIRIRSGNHVPIIFNDKYNAIFFTGILLKYMSNIDIGLTQINYNYWIKKYNIDYSLLFEPTNAISLSSQILKSIGEETNWDIYKMIKYYHSRSYLGDRYAKKVIDIINVLTNLYNDYTNQNEKVAALNNMN